MTYTDLPHGMPVTSQMPGWHFILLLRMRLTKTLAEPKWFFKTSYNVKKQKEHLGKCFSFLNMDGFLENLFCFLAFGEFGITIKYLHILVLMFRKSFKLFNLNYFSLSHIKYLIYLFICVLRLHPVILRGYFWLWAQK